MFCRSGQVRSLGHHMTPTLTWPLHNRYNTAWFPPDLLLGMWQTSVLPLVISSRHLSRSRELHEYILANTNIREHGQTDTRIRTSIDCIILANISRVLEYSIFASIYWVFEFQLSLGGLGYTRLLCKGVIYTIRGPNIQLYMREYIQEIIYLMYGAQHRVRIVRI